MEQDGAYACWRHRAKITENFNIRELWPAGRGSSCWTRWASLFTSCMVLYFRHVRSWALYTHMQYTCPFMSVCHFCLLAYAHAKKKLISQTVGGKSGLEPAPKHTNLSSSYQINMFRFSTDMASVNVYITLSSYHNYLCPFPPQLSPCANSSNQFSLTTLIFELTLLIDFLTCDDARWQI